jgi:multiple sugar transport system substrate-binding protein/putative aldouronate transport system substrate-binding protein
MKKILSVLLTLAMLLSLVSVSAVAEGEKELLTIDVYDDAANYNGIQSGWFAKLIKDKFNIELNIIASQVVGNTIYATRSEEGNLGDILVVDKAKFPEIVEAGLAKDISDKLPACENIMKFKTQIDVYNKGLTGEDGKYYGIPTEMTDTSPTSITDDVIYSSPMLRWDLYKQIGSPKLENLDDLLAALEKIHEVHPTNEEGDPAYPFSLWPDWDGNDNMIGPANVVQLTTWYGQKLKGSAMLMPDMTFSPLYERENAYYKITKFLNQANQKGLVDPDSGTQNWDNACAKMSSGRVDVMWYSWQVGFWNSVDRLNAGTAFRFIPVNDMKFYADADRYFGSDRMFGIGAGVEGEKYDRIMEFLDWYASPEGATFEHDGIEGLNYVVENGKFKPYKDNALMDNLPVPDEFGGGGFSDGNNAINQWIVSAICVNPNTGERYAQKYWQSYKDMTMTEMKKEWTEVFGAEDDVSWMKANDKLLASPSVDFTPAADNNDIIALRAEINSKLCEYTWNLIMTCSTDEEFETMWDAMVAELDGLGYKDLYEYDCGVWQPEVDAKKAAAGM